MRKQYQYSVRKRVISFALFFLGFISVSGASGIFQDPENDIIFYRGIVVDQDNDPLSSVYLSVRGTNIATVTNDDGEFSLRVPSEFKNTVVNISHLGFQDKNVPLKFFLREEPVIALVESVQELSEVNVFDATDARGLVEKMLEKKGDNYSDTERRMNAFYRETIKKGNRNVSLSEAVVTIHKEPYSSYAKDNISLVKARKSADYDRLDTLALKLQGGPFNNLYMDLMKNTDLMFNQHNLGNYIFSFADPTRDKGRYLYVVDFYEIVQNEPWFSGRLFIDAQTATLVKATFDLNVEDRRKAARMFVQRKPGGTKVYPIDVHYDIEYRERDGKWYYGYGNSELRFVVNWDRKLFNSRYTVNSELAVTDWFVPDSTADTETPDFIEPDIVMADDISGFADSAFWGANNIIEPDKSIENAIRKIQQKILD
ncbi:MAG TPA: carboxypeptidase-like regulatory domain-containing protein [Salinimicrobium sp.]|nr:carboxypeptidase-like regulatory domain-containing protein [Salinimicrobium sp.]